MATKHIPHWRFSPSAPPPAANPSLPELPETAALDGQAVVRQLTHDDIGCLNLANRSHPVVTWDAAGIHGEWDWGLADSRSNRLWTITLHYHQWLCQLATFGFGPVNSPNSIDDQETARRIFRSAIESWLVQCSRSSARNTLAWNSYAIATRIGPSIKACELIRTAEAAEEIDHELVERWRECLFQQAHHLYQNLEWDLRANHLLRDAVGLAWAGCYFSGPHGERWKARAHQIAVEQANEQLLPDGGHFERSPFYHLEVMDDWAALAALLPEARCLLREAWKRAADFARWMCHPDGRVAQFNDGGRSLAAPHLQPSEQWQSGAFDAPVQGGRHFPESGFCAWHSAPWTLFFDVGPVGPDCQPGHAHADTLSIECSLHDHLLFADPGCLDYDLDIPRRYDRSTAAHNTVCIDGQDSSEMWHIFRVGRRARPFDVSSRFGADAMQAEAAHDGYRHLAGAPLHRRKVRVDSCGEMRIVDQIEGAAEHHVSGGWLLAPGWSAEQHGQTWRLTHDDGAEAIVELYANQPIEQSQGLAQHRPHYHQTATVPRLQWQFSGKLPLEVTTVVRPVDWKSTEGLR